MISAEDRYRSLLDASSTLADQPTVKAVLHSVRSVLSSISKLHGAELYVLSDDGDSLYTFEFDRDADAPAIKIGTRALRIGAAARVLDEQKPVFVPDLSQEMLKHPELAPFAPEVVGMLRSLASHVAVALECALARDSVELYRRQAEEQRDRLKLLLEINNHIVAKLEVGELFRAVAGSMRKHFGNDATTFWLINKQTGCLERRFIDFPTGRGFLAKVSVAMPSKLESDWWRLGTLQPYAPHDMPDLPPEIREAIEAESLLSSVSVPLVGANGPLGLMNLSSRRTDAFSQADSDLLSQIGTQISLVLDNALAYGRLRASRDDLEEQRLYLESEISSEFNFEDIVGNSSAICASKSRSS